MVFYTSGIQALFREFRWNDGQIELQKNRHSEAQIRIEYYR